MIAAGVVLFAILAVLVWAGVKGHYPYLWREWITSVDHKRIGVMYVLLAMVMLLRGGTDAIIGSGWLNGMADQLSLPSIGGLRR